jgi:hypothetical protein
MGAHGVQASRCGGLLDMASPEECSYPSIAWREGVSNVPGWAIDGGEGVPTARRQRSVGKPIIPGHAA